MKDDSEKRMEAEENIYIYIYIRNERIENCEEKVCF